VLLPNQPISPSVIDKLEYASIAQLLKLAAERLMWRCAFRTGFADNPTQLRVLKLLPGEHRIAGAVDVPPHRLLDYLGPISPRHPWISSRSLAE
jgi:hypothetical protein